MRLGALLRAFGGCGRERALRFGVRWLVAPGGVNATALTLAGVIAILAGCHGQPSATVDTRQSALTASSNAIVGFEATSGWTVTQGSIPAPTLSSTHTQGSSSLAVRAAGYVLLTSSTFPVSANITGPFKLDVLLPKLQANPSWLGAVQIYVNCPSKSLSNGYVGQVDLTGLSTNAFHTLSFPLSSALTSTLAGGCVDFFVGIGVNVAINETGTYLLDNLTFGGSGNKVKPTLNCVTTFDGTHFTAYFGYINLENQVASIPLGPTNTVSPPAPAHSVQPTVFQPGTIPTAASFNFVAGQTVTWTLTAGSASAKSSSPLCPGTTLTTVTCADAMRQSDAGCVHAATLPNPQGPNQDPAVLGEPVPSNIDAAVPPVSPDSGAEEEENEAQIEHTQWTIHSVELLPTQAQSFTIPLSGAGVFHAKARWTTSGSVSLQAVVNGAVLNGVVKLQSTVGGSSSIFTGLQSAGSAQVTVKNTGSTVLSAVQLVVGFTPAQ